VRRKGESFECVSGRGFLLLLPERKQHGLSTLPNGAFLSSFVERLMLFFDVVLIFVVYVHVGTFNIGQT
jgi:hypothetical protein